MAFPASPAEWRRARSLPQTARRKAGGGRRAQRLPGQPQCSTLRSWDAWAFRPRSSTVHIERLGRSRSGLPRGGGSDEKPRPHAGLLHGTTNRKERRTGESGAQTAALRSIEADTIAASTRGERDHVRAVERHGVTVQFGIPQLFAAQLHKQGHRSRDLGSLRLGVAAGAPVSDELLRDAQRLLCPTLLVVYSLTEASSMVSVTRPDDPGEKRSHTVGRPLGGTAVRVLESDGTELPLESVGEVAVRGPGVMKGYYRQPGETAGSFDAQGFLLTGDLGIVDEEGYVHLVGRRKEVIIRSGFNVSPRELEDRLRAHPAVRQSAVVGVPDPALGWARRSVPASFPWRGRSSPAVRSWNGAGRRRPTTRSPTLSAFGTISP